jgi:hypothetical protein
MAMATRIPLQTESSLALVELSRQELEKSSYNSLSHQAAAITSPPAVGLAKTSLLMTCRDHEEK